MSAGTSPAARMLARARAVSACARRTGCGVDEADDILREAAVSRRAALTGAGTAALGLAIPAALGYEPAGSQAADGHQQRVVIIGSGLAGLGCADRLWRRHRIRSEVYEFNPDRAGGRVYTLRGFFDAGQYTEQHGEFISSEHTAMRRLAASLGLTLDNVNRYPPHTHPQDERLRFHGHFWSKAALNREWHEWAWKLFHNAANRQAPWPTLYHQHTHWGWRWDHQPATRWIEEHVRGGLD